VAEEQKNNTPKVLYWTGAVVILLMAGVLFLTWNRLPPMLPWLYSFPLSERQLIEKIWFIWIFAGMEVVLFLTRIIANWAGKNDSTVQNTIMIGVFVAVVLMTASFVKIMMIFLNT